MSTNTERTFPCAIPGCLPCGHPAACDPYHGDTRAGVIHYCSWCEAVARVEEAEWPVSAREAGRREEREAAVARAESAEKEAVALRAMLSEALLAKDALAARLREEQAEVLKPVGPVWRCEAPDCEAWFALHANAKAHASCTGHGMSADPGADKDPAEAPYTGRHILGPVPGGECLCGEPWPCPEREERP